MSKSSADAREKRLQYWRDYYHANREKWKKRHAENYAKNRDEIRRRVSARHWKSMGIVPTRQRPELCECCGGPDNGRALAMDHCHESGAFRGWLCVQCNVGIGALGDNEAGLERALTYLRRGGKPE